MSRVNPRKPGTRHGQCGVATVEMAIVTVLLFFLVAGIADLGRALFTNIGVQDAAQEGTLYGSFRPGSTEDIIERAADATDFPVLDASDIQVNCDSSDDTISVTVSHDMEMFTPIIGHVLGGSITLQHTFTGQVFSECP